MKSETLIRMRKNAPKKRAALTAEGPVKKARAIKLTNKECQLSESFQLRILLWVPSRSLECVLPG